MSYQDIWNNNMLNDYRRLSNKLKIFDRWLDKYIKYINESKLPVIDLGCGLGNDTLYIKSLGKEVVSVDQSSDALRILKDNIKGAITVQMDFEKEWKLEKDSSDLIIANLSLHYFDEKTTFKILNNIRNTLKSEGVLIVRLNTINDNNYGASSTKEIEHHYYESMNIKKRYFDRDDIDYFFKDFELISCKEEKVKNIVYYKEKIVWECVFRNK